MKKVIIRYNNGVTEFENVMNSKKRTVDECIMDALIYMESKIQFKKADSIASFLRGMDFMIDKKHGVSYHAGTESLSLDVKKQCGCSPDCKCSGSCK